MSWIIGEADALPCSWHISVCLRIVDIDSRVRTTNKGLGDEMLPKATEHFVKDHVTKEDVRR